MNPSDTLHCRLCAVKKPIAKLSNLESNNINNGPRATSEIVMIQKLRRLNVNTTGFIEGSNLPKTVCLVCLKSLNKAYEFVEQVEYAQQLLAITCKKVKTEEAISDHDTTVPPLQAQPVNEPIKSIQLVKDEPVENMTTSLPKQPIIKRQPTQPKKVNKVEAISDHFTMVPLLQAQPVNEPIKSIQLVIDELVENVTTSLPKKPIIKKQPSQPNSQLTWKDYNWACGKCETEFPTIQELKSHSMTYHECCNAFKCTDCKKKMLRLDKFVLHVKRHRKHLKLSCYICHSKFSSPYKVGQHKNEHKSSEHICSGCNTMFTSREALNEHIKLYYKNRAGNSITVLDSSDSLSCALCKKTFNNKGTLNGHLLVHVQRNPKKKRGHICDRCGKGFYNKADLATHVISLHNDARPYQCEICKSDFKTLFRLKAHVKIHDNFKPFACTQCGRTFRLQKQLRSHEIVHTDSLPFACPYCSKAFRFKSILNLHLRQHTGDKPYCCELCQRNFTNWSNYNKHMKRRHGTSMVKRKAIWTTDNPPVIPNIPKEEEKGLNF